MVFSLDQCSIVLHFYSCWLCLLIVVDPLLQVHVCMSVCDCSIDCVVVEDEAMKLEIGWPLSSLIPWPTWLCLDGVDGPVPVRAVPAGGPVCGVPAHPPGWCRPTAGPVCPAGAPDTRGRDGLVRQLQYLCGQVSCRCILLDHWRWVIGPDVSMAVCVHREHLGSHCENLARESQGGHHNVNRSKM